MVNVTIMQPIFFKGLEWFLFLGLCILSAYFMREVLDKFISGDTSFKVYEEFIDEIPTMVLCTSEISPPLPLQNEDSFEYKYGKDFNITFQLSVLNKGEWVGDRITIKEGENIYPSRVIFLEKLATAWNGFCYKINETTTKIKNGEWRNVQINFDKTIDRKILPSWVVHFMSEKNAYGILRGWWFDGEMTRINLNISKSKQIVLKPRKYKYFTRCGESSFYECWGSKLVTTNFDVCPRKCLPYSLPNNGYNKISLCNTKEEWDCAHRVVNMVLENITESGTCPKLCTVSHYTGRAFVHGKYITEYIQYWYSIAHPFTATITEEYLIYDIIAVISSVGGTLGMCIGFSFTNIIAYIINLMQKQIDKFQNNWLKQ